MTILTLLAFGFQPEVRSLCVIDQCEETICTVETPDGLIELWKEPGYKEGKKVNCPILLNKPLEENKND